MVRYKNKKAQGLVIGLAAFLCCSFELEKKLPAFTLPDACECIELVNSRAISPDVDYVFRELPDGRPAIMTCNNIIPLEDISAGPLSMSEDISVSNICWYNGSCWFSSASAIYRIDGTGKTYPVLVSDGDVASFCVAGDKIAFRKDSLLVCSDVFSGEKKQVYNTHGMISHIEAVGDLLFLSSGKNLFIMDEGELYRVWTSGDEISTFAICNDGSAFLSTEEAILYIVPGQVVVQIADMPAKALTVIGDDLYIVLSTNDSVKLTNLHALAEGTSRLAELQSKNIER